MNGEDFAACAWYRKMMESPCTECFRLMSETDKWALWALHHRPWRTAAP